MTTGLGRARSVMRHARKVSAREADRDVESLLEWHERSNPANTQLSTLPPASYRKHLQKRNVSAQTARAPQRFEARPRGTRTARISDRKHPLFLTLLTLIAAVLDTALATVVWMRFGRMRAAWYFVGTIAVRTVFAFAHHLYLPAATTAGEVFDVACVRWVLLPIASLLQLLFFLSVYEPKWLTNGRTLILATAYLLLGAALVSDLLARAAPALAGVPLVEIDPYALNPRPMLLALFNLSWIPGTFVVIRTMVRVREERLPLSFVLASTIFGTVLGVVASRMGKLGNAAVLFDVVVTGSFAYLLFHRRVFETTKIAIDRALQSMVEGLAVLSADGQVLFTNPAMERHLRLRVGKPALGDGERDSVIEEMLRSLGKERAETHIERAKRALFVATSPIVDAADELHGHLVIAQDVTAARENERELIRRNDELWRANRVQAQLLRDLEARTRAEAEARRREEVALRAKAAADAASATKSAFLARMSHELRTPLNAILGFAQLMTRDHSLSEKNRVHLEVIGRSGEHLLGLINHVLDLSKIEAGKITLADRPFDLRRLLANVEALFRDRAQKKGLALVFDLDPELPSFVRTDDGKLRQVLINLLGNALKFTETGSITLRAWPDDARPSDAPAEGADPPGADLPDGVKVRLCFEVEDTGPGVGEGAREALFQAFATPGERAEEGSGLGLSISLELARLLGGDLRISSAPGHGAKFALEVQAMITGSVDVAPAKVAPRVTGVASGQPLYRILVVDDRWENRDLLVQVLTIPGFDVRSANDGKEAIAVWEEWNPHAIWMDMRMPVMDGHEATRRIKATLRGQATVIIALTASAFEQDRDAVLSAGCEDFVRKPFHEAEIFEKLEKHLGVRFLHEEAAPQEERGSSPDAGMVAAARGLSSELREPIVRAAKTLSAKATREAITHLRPQDDDLASALDALVGAYRFDRILELLSEGTTP